MKLADHLKSRPGILSAPLVGYPALGYIGAPVEAGVTNAAVQSAALLHYHREARPDVLFPFMDLSIEAEALGLPIRFNEAGGPDVTRHPVDDLADLGRLRFPLEAGGGRCAVVTETIHRLRSETDALIGGYVASPFTLAGLLMGAENLALKTLTEPEVCHGVLDFTTRLCIRYSRTQAEAGAHFITLLEPTAALLSPALYEAFVGPYVEGVIRELPVPVVLHVCGQTTNLIPSFIKNPVQGISLDSSVDLARAGAIIPEDVAIIGNIAPVEVMLNMDATAVRRAVRDLLEEMSRRPNYVASTGCDLPFAVKRENLLAFTTAVRDFNEPARPSICCAK